ncbi:MAG: flavodoxin family protein [Candidatus Gastranaerophilales bacterium]|nr:flavodoxin family protein [Candidatus Gastranaerophilales bacterium]
MKNVLIISSSPRKGGNSDVLCDEFLKGAQIAGNNVQKIFLRDKKINYCTGCGFCNTTDYTKCSQNDDMPEILDKMEQSDVIVFATPIYFYAIAGQMKTFIDRICSRYTHLDNKEFYYIITAADTSKSAIQFALGEFKGLMACLNNPVEKGYLFAGGVWKKDEIKDTPYINQAFEMGKNI